VAESCPICFELVDEKVSRLNAVWTVIISGIFVFTTYKWVIGVLLVDFFLRGFVSPKYSYISYLSKTILRVFKSSPKPVNAGPKVFAAKVGFVFCVFIVILYWFKYFFVSELLAVLLGFFAFLEAVFGFCLACKLYPLFFKGSS